MKIIAIALACAVGFSNAAFALEPWHDYYTAKAMKEKAAKKRLEKADKQSQRPQAAKETREDASKQRKEKN